MSDGGAGAYAGASVGDEGREGLWEKFWLPLLRRLHLMPPAGAPPESPGDQPH
ncbi:MAG TPA: hypothetical protein PKI09_04895 [Dermatophilaceae bacterium]|jgi:hypothetical protein|nr:hypothetical protein [Dermatophilaceae bacterium]HPZ68723.1 hypothetical protein [Dermatophilaceae bacterium]